VYLAADEVDEWREKLIHAETLKSLLGGHAEHFTKLC
jgi:hypothetical protein